MRRNTQRRMEKMEKMERDAVTWSRCIPSPMIYVYREGVVSWCCAHRSRNVDLWICSTNSGYELGRSRR